MSKNVWWLLRKCPFFLLMDHLVDIQLMHIVSDCLDPFFIIKFLIWFFLFLSRRSSFRSGWSSNWLDCWSRSLRLSYRSCRFWSNSWFSFSRYYFWLNLFLWFLCGSCFLLWGFFLLLRCFSFLFHLITDSFSSFCTFLIGLELFVNFCLADLALCWRFTKIIEELFGCDLFGSFFLGLVTNWGVFILLQFNFNFL